MRPGAEVDPGAMGRVLVTTLENYLMPLVRYEIGDYAIAARGTCSCGRTLPLIGRVMERESKVASRICQPLEIVFSRCRKPVNLRKASRSSSEIPSGSKCITSFRIWRTLFKPSIKIFRSIASRI